jgi:UDP-glucose:(heptosyl)LPS alpha-1,3-glucosyltransferase
VPLPFEQATLDRMLAEMLADAAARRSWSCNGLTFAAQADLYSRPEHAANIILGDAN